MTSDAAQPNKTLPQLGRYQLLAKLGQGGMGEVYLAHDGKLNRRVAVKVLPADSIHDAGAVARFRREAQALAQLGHPGIVQAHDSGEEAGRHFLVMEFVEGASLAAVLKEKGRIPPAHAADYIYQAALALQHAHDKGLVHRDLKPSNLLLTPQGQVKILDLGLARFLQDQIDAALTREGTGMGTPDYAAPEQFRDAHSADARSDIYSLGCTLYHLLTGRVPFPGSSFSEKYEAHAHKEPPPIEELCPEVPGGLALAVQKMMAKRPADRFQTAAEAAEALAPFVAASSASFQSVRNTSSWEGGRLTVRDPRLRRRWPRYALAAVAGAALVLLAVVFGPRWFGGRQPQDNTPVVEADKDKPPDQPSRPPGKDAPARLVKDPSPALPDDPDVLTVSKTKAGGGKYQTISAALDRVQRGQTIRVLDQAVYCESLLLNLARHSDITLEAIRGATLELGESWNLLSITGVTGVTVRGFRLVAKDVPRQTKAFPTLVYVNKGASGLLLERLTFVDEGNSDRVNGLEVTNTPPPGRRMTVVRNCTFEGLSIALGLAGVSGDYRVSFPVANVLLRDNLIMRCGWGIYLKGDVRSAQVVGNRIWQARWAALQLERLPADTDNILVANNTVFESEECFRLWDVAINSKGVQIRNNLFLGTKPPDMVFYRSKDPQRAEGAGEGDALHRSWRLDHNWREAEKPKGTSLRERGWIPPGPADVLQGSITGVKRDSGDRANFLRPDKGSPAATKGAGQTDPWLPSYVGALPPEGVEPWDWDRTWRAEAPGRHVLLTVSEKEEGGGKFRTINDALRSPDLKPWATIRVLDGETYPEAVLLDDPIAHKGIVLEAPKRAVLEMGPGVSRLIQIKSVPHVRVSGFRLRDKKGTRLSTFVAISGRVPGVIVEDLELRTDLVSHGMMLTTPRTGEQDPPVVVRRCFLQTRGEGITVSGAGEETGGPLCGGVAVRDNVITGTDFRALVLVGGLERVQVVGNRVSAGRASGLQTEDLGSASRRILIANNTSFNNGFGFRYFCNSEPRATVPAGQVELSGNLLLESSANDMGCVLVDGGSAKPVPAFAKALAARWRFRRNWRDLQNSQPQYQIPLHKDDRQLEAVSFVSRTPDSPDYLRPLPDSPLAREGPGNLDPTLPTYVGAVPPKGVKRWDWDRVWRSRLGKPMPGKEKS